MKRAVVVAAHAQRRLRQVVGAEAEELSRLGDLVGRHGSARHFDHRAHQVLHLDLLLGEHLLGHVADDLRPGAANSFWKPTSGIMTSGSTLIPSFCTRQAASKTARACMAVISGYTMPKRQPRCPSMGFDSCNSCTRRWIDFDLLAQDLGHFRLSDRFVGQELVQRRIQQADRHRLAGHGPEQAGEIVALERQHLGQGLFAILAIVGHDHLAHFGDVIEEHVLGPAQADALGAERHGGRGLFGQIGVGADAQLAMLLGPVHDLLELLINRGLFGLEALLDQHLQDFTFVRLDRAGEHFAREAVDRDVVAFLEHLVLHA